MENSPFPATSVLPRKYIPKQLPLILVPDHMLNIWKWPTIITWPNVFQIVYVVSIGLRPVLSQSTLFRIDLDHPSWLLFSGLFICSLAHLCSYVIWSHSKIHICKDIIFLYINLFKPRQVYSLKVYVLSVWFPLKETIVTW